jgi:hypothetical protein
LYGAIFLWRLKVHGLRWRSWSFDASEFHAQSTQKHSMSNNECFLSFYELHF